MSLRPGMDGGSFTLQRINYWWKWVLSKVSVQLSQFWHRNKWKFASNGQKKNLESMSHLDGNKTLCEHIDGKWFEMFKLQNSVLYIGEKPLLRVHSKRFIPKAMFLGQFQSWFIRTTGNSMEILEYIGCQGIRREGQEKFRQAWQLHYLWNISREKCSKDAITKTRNKVEKNNCAVRQCRWSWRRKRGHWQNNKNTRTRSVREWFIDVGSRSNSMKKLIWKLNLLPNHQDH